MYNELIYSNLEDLQLRSRDPLKSLHDKPRALVLLDVRTYFTSYGRVPIAVQKIILQGTSQQSQDFTV